MLCCVEFLQISRVTLDSFELHRGTDPNSATKALNNRTGVGTIPRRQRRTLSVYESNVSWCPRRGRWGPWDFKKKEKKSTYSLYISVKILYFYRRIPPRQDEWVQGERWHNHTVFIWPQGLWTNWILYPFVPEWNLVWVSCLQLFLVPPTELKL